MKTRWTIRENSLPIERKTIVDFPDQRLDGMVNSSTYRHFERPITEANQFRHSAST